METEVSSSLDRAPVAMHAPAMVKLMLLAGLLLSLVVLLRQIDLRAWLDPSWIAAMLERCGVYAPVVFIAMMSGAVIFSPIPSWPLDVAAGVAFGPWLGTLYAAAGAEIGAVIGFLVARWLGRDAIKRVMDPDAFLCPGCSDGMLGRLILVMRLIPGVSFDVVSYGAGLTAIRLRTFALATFLGMLPPTFLLVYSGREVLMAGSTGKVVAAAIMAALLLSPLIVRRRGWLGAARAPSSVTVERKCRGCGAWFPLPKLRISAAGGLLVATLVTVILAVMIL
jgi:uncharacterized membrane protein YdjX (TVP38/TMEM64 family)